MLFPRFSIAVLQIGGAPITERSNEVMQNGVVKWFDVKKGYGFIVGDDGNDAFVHQSSILMNGFRFLEAGQHVSYCVEPSDRGNKAINVVVAQ